MNLNEFTNDELLLIKDVLSNQIESKKNTREEYSSYKHIGDTMRNKYDNEINEREVIIAKIVVKLNNENNA